MAKDNLENLRATRFRFAVTNVEVIRVGHGRETKKMITRGRGAGGILRRRMSIKRRGRLTITETSTKAGERAPFRTPLGSSRDNLYGNSRDVISPPWQTLAAATHEGNVAT